MTNETTPTGGPGRTIPENILRAADAIIAYPEAYEGYALILAKFLRDSWPSIPSAPQGDPSPAPAGDPLAVRGAFLAGFKKACDIFGEGRVPKGNIFASIETKAWLESKPELTVAPAYTGTVQAPAAVLFPYLSAAEADKDPHWSKCGKCGSYIFHRWNHCPDCATPRAGAPSAGRPMTWTREAPKVQGWYFQRANQNMSPIQWEVFWVEPDRGFFSPYGEDYEAFPDGFEWAGPIPDPEDERSESGGEQCQ